MCEELDWVPRAPALWSRREFRDSSRGIRRLRITWVGVGMRRRPGTRLGVGWSQWDVPAWKSGGRAQRPLLSGPARIYSFQRFQRSTDSGPGECIMEGRQRAGKIRTGSTALHARFRRTTRWMFSWCTFAGTSCTKYARLRVASNRPKKILQARHADSGAVDAETGSQTQKEGSLKTLSILGMECKELSPRQLLTSACGGKWGADFRVFSPSWSLPSSLLNSSDRLPQTHTRLFLQA